MFLSIRRDIFVGGAILLVCVFLFSSTADFDLLQFPSSSNSTQEMAHTPSNLPMQLPMVTNLSMQTVYKKEMMPAIFRSVGLDQLGLDPFLSESHKIRLNCTDLGSNDAYMKTMLMKDFCSGKEEYELDFINASTVKIRKNVSAGADLHPDLACSEQVYSYVLYGYNSNNVVEFTKFLWASLLLGISFRIPVDSSQTFDVELQEGRDNILRHFDTLSMSPCILPSSNSETKAMHIIDQRVVWWSSPNDATLPRLTQALYYTLPPAILRVANRVLKQINSAAAKFHSPKWPLRTLTWQERFNASDMAPAWNEPGPTAPVPFLPMDGLENRLIFVAVHLNTHKGNFKKCKQFVQFLNACWWKPKSDLCSGWRPDPKKVLAYCRVELEYLDGLVNKILRMENVLSGSLDAPVDVLLYLAGSPTRVAAMKNAVEQHNSSRLKYHVIEYDQAEFGYRDSRAQLVDQIVSAYAGLFVGDAYSTHARLVSILQTRLIEVGQISPLSKTNFELHGFPRSAVDTTI